MLFILYDLVYVSSENIVDISTTQFFKKFMLIWKYVPISYYMLHEHKQTIAQQRTWKGRYALHLQEVAKEKNSTRENKHNSFVVLMQEEKIKIKNSDQNIGHFCTFYKA